MKSLFRLAKARSASGVQVKGVEGEISLVRGHHHLAVVPDETLLKVGKAQESLKLFQGHEFRPLWHHSELFRVCSYLPTLTLSVMYPSSSRERCCQIPPWVQQQGWVFSEVQDSGHGLGVEWGVSDLPEQSGIKTFHPNKHCDAGLPGFKEVLDPFMPLQTNIRALNLMLSAIGIEH